MVGLSFKVEVLAVFDNDFELIRMYQAARNFWPLFIGLLVLDLCCGLAHCYSIDDVLADGVHYHIGHVNYSTVDLDGLLVVGYEFDHLYAKN